MKRIALVACLLCLGAAPAAADGFVPASPGAGFFGGTLGAGAVLGQRPTVFIVTSGLLADFDPSLHVTTAVGTNNVSSWADSVAGYTVSRSASAAVTLVPNAFRGRPAIAFNGTSLATLINTSTNLVSSGPLTVVAMVLPDGGTGATGTVYMFRTSSEGITGMLGLSGAKRVSLGSTSRFSPILVPSIPVTSIWSYDNSYNLRAFQYGSQAQPLTLVTQDPPSGATGFQLGNAQTWTDAPLNAKVLRALVYGRELTAAERAQDVAAMDGLYYPHATTGEVKASDFWDNGGSYPITLGGQTTVATNCMSVLKLAVPAGVTSVPVVLSTDQIAGGEDPSVAVFVDGSFGTAWTPTTDNDLETFTLSLDGAAHSVELHLGYQTLPMSQTAPLGTFVQSVPSTVAIVPPAVADRCVLDFGDSIGAGCCASVIPHTSWPALLRQALRASGTRVIVDAFGARTLGGAANVSSSETDEYADVNALAEHIVAELAPCRRRVLWFQMGFNDYVHANITLATWTTTLGNLLDAVHADDPTITVFLQGWITSSLENTRNVNNELPDDYRTAESVLAAARPGWVQFVNLKNAVPLIDLPGGVHPNDAGSVLYEAPIPSILGP